MEFERLMHLALSEARKSRFDVPVGAVIVDSQGQFLSTGHNQREANSDASGHAEIEAIRSAGRELRDWRLGGCTLVVSLEPCLMCAGAIVNSRISRVVFGAWDLKRGASGSLYDVLRDPRLGRPIEVLGGVLEQECAALLSDFFTSQRTHKPD